ncbi:hypothetical protein FZEAL_9623 [Fusarium zealandicum]|uniref:Chromo domain-containing protein n=1 Tax=Fusarium zealandicum TaxID=1053134 RepID=A0A8H4U9Q2_9HYPO|nr:hypothetical protein FZEAL_9623 [Fusarium zealandicum]
MLDPDLQWQPSSSSNHRLRVSLFPSSARDHSLDRRPTIVPMPGKRGQPRKSNAPKPTPKPKPTTNPTPETRGGRVLRSRKKVDYSEKLGVEEEEDAPRAKETESAWYSVRGILDDKLKDGVEYYLVDWETVRGEVFDATWVPGYDIKQLTLDKYHENKRLKRLEKERKARKATVNLTESIEDDEPRPANWRRQQPQHANASNLTRSRSDSVDDNERPRKKARTEPEGTHSEEPVPSILSISSVDDDASSPAPLDSNDFAQLQAQKVTIELSKPANFDDSEYQSVSNAQDSSQKVSELEEDDQRAAFASQLSQDTIPDSQDLSGHLWLDADFAHAAIAEEIEQSDDAESPDINEHLALGHSFEIVNHPEDVAGQSEAHSPRDIETARDINVSLYVPTVKDDHRPKDRQQLSDVDSPSSDQASPKPASFQEDQDLEEDRNTELDSPRDIQDVQTPKLPQGGEVSHTDQDRIGEEGHPDTLSPQDGQAILDQEPHSEVDSSASGQVLADAASTEDGQDPQEDQGTGIDALQKGQNLENSQDLEISITHQDGDSSQSEEELTDADGLSDVPDAASAEDEQKLQGHQDTEIDRLQESQDLGTSQSLQTSITHQDGDGSQNQEGLIDADSSPGNEELPAANDQVLLDEEELFEKEKLLDEEELSDADDLPEDQDLTGAADAASVRNEQDLREDNNDTGYGSPQDTQDSEADQPVHSPELPQLVDSSRNEQVFQDEQEFTSAGSVSNLESHQEDHNTALNSLQNRQATLNSPNPQPSQDFQHECNPIENQDTEDVREQEEDQDPPVVDHPPSNQDLESSPHVEAQQSAPVGNSAESCKTISVDQDLRVERAVTAPLSSDNNRRFTSTNSTSDQRLRQTSSSEVTRPEKPSSSSGRISISSLVIPDSQDHSLTSTDSHPHAAQALTCLPQPQVTPIASQIEVVPDSVTTSSDIPSHQPEHPRPDSVPGQDSSGASVQALPELDSLAQAARATLEKLSSSNESPKQPLFFTQPQSSHLPLGPPSSGSLEVPRISSQAGQAASCSSPQVPSASKTQLGSEQKEFQAYRSFESILEKIRRSCEPDRGDGLKSLSSGNTKKPHPLSQSVSAESTQPSRPVSQAPAMDSPSAAQPQSSAVDELKNLCDFGDESLLTQIGGSTGDALDPVSSDAQKDQEHTTSDLLGQMIAPPDVVVSSPGLQMNSQPIFSVEPWKAEVLGNTPEAPAPSISPAAIMANPSPSAADSIREMVNEAFGDEAESMTRSLIPGDPEEIIPLGTVSPAAISRSADPAESTHTMTLTNQGTMPSRIVESSGESITMGQIPDEQSDASSQSSHQEGHDSQRIVTLPMQASRRPTYDAILREHRGAAMRFGDAFINEMYVEPDAALVEKIDSLFSRLLNICDYPQDVVGTRLEEIPSPDMAGYSCDANSKLSFLFELMSALGEKEIGILIVARAPELLQLIFNLTEAAGIECSAESIGKQSTYPSVTRITLALASEEFDPYKFDVVIGYDHLFSSSPMAKELAINNVRKSPLVLLLVTTHTIEHIGTRLSPSLPPLERKNALLSSIVLARNLLVSPETGYRDPYQVAKVFANYLNGVTEALNYVPQDIPENVFNIWAQSQSLSQLLFDEESTEGTLLKRKFDDTDDDDDAKRMRVLPQNELPVDTNDPPIPLAVRQLLESVRSSGRTKERQSKISIPLSSLVSLTERVEEYKRKSTLQDEVEDEYKSTISRLEQEVGGHRRTADRTSEHLRKALQDRKMFEQEKQKAVVAAGAAAETAQKERERQQKRIEELELTITRLKENPGAAQRENLLNAAREQVQKLENKLERLTRDADFYKSRYQSLDAQSSGLANENKELKQQHGDLRARAAENLFNIHKHNNDSERQGLEQNNASLRAQLMETQRSLSLVNEEVQVLRNGRPQTRQASMPRSPRIPTMMSPRTGRAPFSGSASRGTSPAPVPGYDGGVVLGAQFIGQQPGSGRWGAHLRE